MQHGQVFELNTTGPDGERLWPIASASTDVARDGSSVAATPAPTTRVELSSGR